MEENKADDEKATDEKKAKSEENDYLFYKLLKLVKSEQLRQLETLESNLDRLISSNKHDWNALVTFDIKDEYHIDKIRQDTVPNGIVSNHNIADLVQHTSAAFNSSKFYDFNEYLPKLVLLAHIVDDKFQKS